MRKAEKMMLHKTLGIVLYTTKYSESSLIAKVYTRNFGLQSYIITGVRSKKSKIKANLFQPLALVDLIVSNSEKGSLQRISEINIHYSYLNIPYNISKCSIALFLNEVLYKALNIEQPDEALFDFIDSSLQILDLKQENCANFHLCFLLQLSRHLGFYPQGNYSAENSLFDLPEGRYINYLPNHPNYLNTRQSSLLTELMDSRYETLHLLKIDTIQRKELLQNLITYYQLHINSFGEIKSKKVLEEIIM